jgi:predicted enzyme related to lactoylglutathione lyase
LLPWQETLRDVDAIFHFYNALLVWKATSDAMLAFTMSWKLLPWTLLLVIALLSG